MQQSLFGSLLVQVEDRPEPAVGRTDLESPLEDVLFTVIDVETTGLNAKKNFLTEVTAIQYKNGEEIGKYSTFVKPGEVIPPEVENLTGITNEMVQQAPAVITVLTELCAFAGASPVIVGHNVGFDIRFLSEKLEQSGLSNFAGRFDINKAVCSRALALKALPNLPSYEGVMVASACGVYNPNPHRAENDVRMSAGILFALIDRLRQEHPAMKTLADLLEYQGPLS